MTPALKGQALENRRRQAARLAAGLDHGSTRLMMLLVVSGAAAVSFLSSVLLLWMGLRYMPVRYAVAILAGYGVFLALMNRWLGHHSRSWLLDRVGDLDNSLDLTGGLVRGGSRSAGRAADNLFRGGHSGGGGASASFDAAGVSPSGEPAPLIMTASAHKGNSKGLSLDLNDSDAVLPVLAVIAIVAGLVACLSVIWQAPQMLAELLADGAVAGVAYQGLRTSTGDWTFGVIRRTWPTATAILITFVLLGYAGHHLKPGADSIGDFFR